MKLGPHLHRIGNDIVAAYLVETDEGVTVVDAGLGRSLAGAARRALRHRPLARRRPRSHPHPRRHRPHRLRRAAPPRPRRTGLRPRADAARARGEVKSKTPFGTSRSAPWPASYVRGPQGGLRTTYLSEVVEVRDGQVLDLPGAPRSSGCPATRRAASPSTSPVADAVFVGDALTTRHVLTGRSGPQPAPFTDDPALGAASLPASRDCGATWVLPGHGTPWNEGVVEAVRRIKAAAQAGCGGRQSWPTAVIADDGRAGLVGGGQVDLGADAPVVVAGRVVEDLPDRPRVPAARSIMQQRRAAGVRAGADLVVLVEVRRRAPRPSASASQPASASSSPSSSQRRSAASSTRRNSALRTSTRNARALRGDRRRPVVQRPRRPPRRPGLRSCSHSSSRLESTWRTSSPSHSMRSVSSSVSRVLGHGLPQRLVRVGEVAQHQALGAGQPVEADVLGEGHRPLVHVADHRLGRQLVVGDPRVPAPVRSRSAASSSSASGLG